MKITVTFDLNEPQVETVKKIAQIEPSWHYCNLLVRIDGQDKVFESDFMRAFFQTVRKQTGTKSLWDEAIEKRDREE